MIYRRVPIEVESPEQLGYGNIECNLAESSISDARLGEMGRDLGDLLVCYGDHFGHPALREMLAAEAPGLSPDDVLLTAGAAAALFIINTSLLHPGDHLIVAQPNYATNIETPRAIGCDAEFLRLTFEEGFRIDPDRIERMMRPETRLVSLTCPHNPTGAVMSEADLRQVIEIVERRGARLLFDETYREMTFGGALPIAASLSPRAISVSSLSKTYGLPGIRAGWLLCRDRQLMETFLAAKEQIFICGSTLDEAVAARVMERKRELLAEILPRIRRGFKTTRDWMRGESRLEWVEPAGGVVGFPRIKSGLGIDVERFYEVLNGAHKTFVGPGHWFEMERRYMRIGFGWPAPEELQRGLERISSALAEATG